MRTNLPQNVATSETTSVFGLFTRDRTVSVKPLAGGAMAMACLMAVSSPEASAAVFDFEAPKFALGDTYGAPAGHVPGTVVFSNHGVKASVEDFTLGAFVGFNFSQIAGHPGPPTSMFPAAINPTQALNINNINMRYDFSGAPLPVQRVVFDYADRGGAENFEINATGRQEVPDLSAIVAPAGFTVNVSVNPLGGGVYGRVEVIADPGRRIEAITVGGQEFAMDNLLKEVRARADFNMDGTVDLLDLDILGAGWGMADPRYENGDSNCDGKVDLLDLDVLGAQWGAGSPAFASALAASGLAVPEPASLALAGMGALMVLRRRRS